jgi:hypothetical protein
MQRAIADPTQGLAALSLTIAKLLSSYLCVVRSRGLLWTHQMPGEKASVRTIWQSSAGFTSLRI